MTSRHTVMPVRSLFLALAFAAAAPAAPAAAQGRVVTTLDADWGYLERAMSSPQAARTADGWEAVSLPHSWNVWDTADLEPGYRELRAAHLRSAIPATVFLLSVPLAFVSPVLATASWALLLVTRFVIPSS